MLGNTVAKVAHDRRAVHLLRAVVADLPRRSWAAAPRRVVPVLHWVQSGNLTFDWALRVDTLTAVMLVVITTSRRSSTSIAGATWSEDPDQPRFFAYLSLFTFAMLMLVTADNLVQMFFGWEGVGLASYLLIGFWFKKPSGQCRRDQGLRGQPRGRPWLHARHLRHVPGVRHGFDPRDP
jgi:NADH:ubiquinone oxidoreductase subunit 5 (subunit L)/multisubunit Na+/H+ antiporter MnhA subunit